MNGDRDMKSVLIGSIMLISAFSAFGKSLEGYGNTKWGMSPEQVVRAEGGKARALDKPIKYSGSEGLVKIDNTKIANRDFDITYLFVNDHLVQVNVSAKGKSNILINRDVFNNLESLLTQKYGSPTYSDAGKSIAWRLGETTVNLSMLNIEGVISSLSVSYKPSSALSADTGAL